MSRFLEHIFNAQEVYSSGEKKFSISKEKFFLINGLWFAIMEGDSLSEKTYNHVALKVSDDNFEKYVKRVQSLDIEILNGRNRISGEEKIALFL